jgi:hypothetical protein
MSGAKVTSPPLSPRASASAVTSNAAGGGGGADVASNDPYGAYDVSIFVSFVRSFCR